MPRLLRPIRPPHPSHRPHSQLSRGEMEVHVLQLHSLLCEIIRRPHDFPPGEWSEEGQVLLRRMPFHLHYGTAQGQTHVFCTLEEELMTISINIPSEKRTQVEWIHNSQ